MPLSFIPFHTLLGRTHGVEEISRNENLKHTAVFRLALGRTIPNVQASWVKMGLDAATEALRWGVNDLGGTLMEESISRMAGSYHGVRLEPHDLIAAAHRAGLRSTSTVMFGHIEEPWELAEHMRVVRDLQKRTGGFTEFVPLSFVPFHTLLGRSIVSLQASWVKMGLDAATEALRWGVNDLGGTLMEESISRMAGSYHGVRLDPDDLVGAAHRAGRPAAERTTLYEIRRRHELAAAA